MINRVKYYLIIASFVASAIATKLLLYDQRGGKALHICTFSSHIQCDGFFSLSKHMRREHTYMHIVSGMDIVSYNKQYNTNMHNMHSIVYLKISPLCTQHGEMENEQCENYYYQHRAVLF